MSTVEVTPAYIKGLFLQLVKVVGGVHAAGAYLGISDERVSQLQRMTCADLPTFMHVATLEQACGQSIVFASLAKLAQGPAGDANLLKESCELSEASLDLQRAIRTGASEREIQALVSRVMREAADLPPVLAAKT